MNAFGTGFVHGAIAAVIAWPVVFAIRAYARKNPSGGQIASIVSNCPFCSTALTVTSDLFGKDIQCPTCQAQFRAHQPRTTQGANSVLFHWLFPYFVTLLVFLVLKLTLSGSPAVFAKVNLEKEIRKSIEEKLRADAVSRNWKVKKFNLVHDEGTKYTGLVELDMGDAGGARLEVNATYDGRTYLWKFADDSDSALESSSQLEPLKTQSTVPKKENRETEDILQWNRQIRDILPHVEQTLRILNAMDKDKTTNHKFASQLMLKVKYEDVVKVLQGMHPVTPKVQKLHTAMLSLYAAQAERAKQKSEALHFNRTAELRQLAETETDFQNEVAARNRVIVETQQEFSRIQNGN